jgi:hypothetical protein
MSRRLVAVCLFTLCLSGIPTASAPAQEGSAEADMARYMELASPGPHHAYMRSRTGTWDVTSEMYMDPSQPPMESSGTSTQRLLMDGRFLEESNRATMMGMPWEGRGTYGYDNYRKKHIGVWFDSFGTSMMTFEGDCDGSCSVITLTGSYQDPLTGTTRTMKTVTRNVSAAEYVFEMYDVAADGEESLQGVVTYRRAED